MGHGLKGKDGIFHMAWCGAEECGMKIEQGTEKGVLGVDMSKHGDGKCIACGKDTHMWVNVANTF